MRKFFLTLLICLCCIPALGGDVALVQWQFRADHDYCAKNGWTKVRIPHDWAISGSFDRANDLQTVAVRQNREVIPSLKTGRSGGLPWVGKGCYRTSVRLKKNPASCYRIYFDGAMSEAKVLVNGREAGFWPYGYNAFHFDITDALMDGSNEIVVLLENKEQSSRWYPGAGLYRHASILERPKVHIPVWGTVICAAPDLQGGAVVEVSNEIEGLTAGERVTVTTVLRDASGREVARREDCVALPSGRTVKQALRFADVSLWSPESPYLYTAECSVAAEGVTDTSCKHFGVRSVAVRPEEGFFLNGKRTMMQGVCMHHDLGPLGAAVNKAALRHHLLMLKDMGCNAIRTSHNMPAEELVDLCDEMGFMLMVEAFDEWDIAKCRNGYHRFFAQWAEKDMVNMLRHFRSNPSVVMWSIGNEVPSQRRADGARTAIWLQDICHREDPTRPVCCGIDQFDSALGNGFAAVLDVPGFNYKVSRYPEAYATLPQRMMVASESASTVSSRGVYHFPARRGHTMIHPDHQSSSYDLECCSWSNLPDDDFAADEDLPYLMGQFVWTGFDYLGEPTPYDIDSWPNHSSLFGIIDLASIPKDRFWLYRSVWNRDAATLHILPHWTWPGMEGRNIPVYVYSSYPAVELFLNGRSLGVRRFSKDDVLRRHRLMWDDVVYEPGELKAVAYDINGTAAAEKVVRTAGEPYALRLEADRSILACDGNDVAYITVSIVDRDGNEVPSDSRQVDISVSGAGSFEGVANGDPCCLESFKQPSMHLFSGKLSFIVRSGERRGRITATVCAGGVRKASTRLEVR